MASKLGYFVQTLRDKQLQRHIIVTSQPALIVTMDHDRGFWEDVRRACPKTVIIGRMAESLSPSSWGQIGAQVLYDRIMACPNRSIYHGWMGWNEPSLDDLQRACQLDTTMMDKLGGSGIEWLAGSWPVGVPDVTSWTTVAMRAVAGRAAWVGLHEYSAPTLDDPHGLWADRGRGWYTLRYRMVHDQLAVNKVPHKLAITELGIDGGVPWVNRPRTGWRKYLSEGQYLEQLVWYDRCLQEDSYVVGAAIFGLGMRPEWASYDILGTMGLGLAQYMEAANSGSDPDPAPDPVEERLRIAESKLGRIKAILDEG